MRGQLLKLLIGDILGASNGGQRNEQIDLLFEVFRHKTCTSEHLSRSARVTNISQLFLTSFVQDKINLSWHIIHSKVNIISFPELLLRLVHADMGLTIPSSTIVA